MNAPRLIVAALVSVTAGLAVATPAFAHIDPDPTEAQAGSEVSVGFTVEHGCEGSPTVQLDMRLPDGTTNPVPEPPTGWTGNVDGNVVTFAGGPLADDQELTFRVAMVLPPTPDTTIYFPFVQRCEVGEIRWIDIPTDNSTVELDEPAPAMQLFGPVATTVAAPTTAAPATTVAATTTSPATIAPTTTTAPTQTSTAATTAPVAEDTAPTSTELPPTILAESSDSGSSGTVVFIAVLVALAAVATIVVVQARRRRP